MKPFGREAAHAAAASISLRIGDVTPVVAIVLGSGLGGLVNDVTGRVVIPYGDIPGLPGVSVTGHAGELVFGYLATRAVLIFAGRFHAYEGHPLPLTAFPARIAYAMGARTLFVSNAAGGINSGFAPGDLMVIEDHLNLTFTSPLVGSAEPGETRFPDMCNAYDLDLRESLHRTGDMLGIELRDGVYAMLSGPAYETPAEVRMLRTLGADAVGMSTVPEVTVARMLGMRVAGVSCITNLGAGMEQTPLDHAEVLETTARVAASFQALVRGFVAAI